MSQRGNRHIFVVADYFSKWCKAYPVPTIDAPVEVFVENCISHYDVTLELRTNQGRNFKSNLFSEICKQEQFNRTLLQHLSNIVCKHQEDQDHYISFFMLTYRSLIRESVQRTPAKVICGHELRLPCDLEFFVMDFTGWKAKQHVQLVK